MAWAACDRDVMVTNSRASGKHPSRYETRAFIKASAKRRRRREGKRVIQAQIQES